MVMATALTSASHKGLADVTNGVAAYGKDEAREPADSDSDDDGFNDFLAFLGTPKNSPDTPNKKTLEEDVNSTVVVEAEAVVVEEAKVLAVEEHRREQEQEQEDVAETEDETTDTPSSPGETIPSEGDAYDEEVTKDAPLDLASAEESAVSSDWMAAAEVARRPSRSSFAAPPPVETSAGYHPPQGMQYYGAPPMPMSGTGFPMGGAPMGMPMQPMPGMMAPGNFQYGSA